GALHGWLCSLPRVNDVAVGIALMLLGVGLAFFLGKPFIQPVAPHLPTIALGTWSDVPQIRAALEIHALFVAGAILALALRWLLGRTRWGMMIRVVGESAPAARAIGYDVERVRLLATMAGGFLAGVGGCFLSLGYPGSWNEGLSSGQGLMAVALVIFARWGPVRCRAASPLVGGGGPPRPGPRSGGR